MLKHKPSLARTAPSKNPTSLPSTAKASEMENFKSLMKQRLDTMKQQCEILKIVRGHCLNDKADLLSLSALSSQNPLIPVAG